MPNNLGILKHTTNEKCPICGRPLQIRIRQSIVIFEGLEEEKRTEYIRCSNTSGCEYEAKSVKKNGGKEKRHKRKGGDDVWT